ncbi:transposase [Streptomyces sp. NPDC002785]|uniref:transposase n=1 Tax=Streptomyces sp. NPDC002785 TaxID=3154543 RepID=UPI00332359C8
MTPTAAAIRGRAEPGPAGRADAAGPPGGGLRPVGEDGLLPAVTQHLMQAALEAELDEHLAAEAERGGGRGSRTGGNGRNGYRTKKVMSEVGPITLQIPRDRLGTFRPRILPKSARRTGALDEMVLSLTARGMASGEIVAHLEEVYGMKTSKETISTITDKALDSMNEWRTRPLGRLTLSRCGAAGGSRGSGFVHEIGSVTSAMDGNNSFSSRSNVSFTTPHCRPYRDRRGSISGSFPEADPSFGCHSACARHGS